MKILHTIASLHQSAGGPSRSVTELCNHIGTYAPSVDLLTVGSVEDNQACVFPDPLVVSLHSKPGRFLPVLNIDFCPGFINLITDLHTKKDLSLLHDHGLWLPNNQASSKAANKLNIPLVITPRGMLEPWALKYRGWKKKPVWWLWQKSAVENAALLHATSSEEANNLRALGLRNPIAVIPNGVDLPTLGVKETKPQQVALFLSRIHPIKGLLNLIKAWEVVNPDGWKLIIAGPDEAGHKGEVLRAIESNGLSSQVEFAGSVDGQQKWDLYRQADLFILPAFSENFGIVVAEALASEVPVITTKGTPWKDLRDYQCGWWIETGVDPLVEALKSAMELTDTERNEMGKRGRVLVNEKFSWEKIAEDMINAYRWVLDGGPPPDCVRLD